MSLPHYDKKLRHKRRFNRLIKHLSSPIRKLGCRRPANVDFILNRQDYAVIKERVNELIN